MRVGDLGLCRDKHTSMPKQRNYLYQYYDDYYDYYDDQTNNPKIIVVKPNNRTVVLIKLDL